jgi:hypothetical protein
MTGGRRTQKSNFLYWWRVRPGRRGCSDEGNREFQELTSECVLTTPIRSLVHKHYTFNYTQDRHGHRSPWNDKSTCSAVSRKKPLCLSIWMVFVCAHTRSYIFMTYENVSGSFETPSSFRNVRTRHELAYVRKVVTSSLTRFLINFLLVHATSRHMRTKRHTFIWTSVCTQETKWDLRKKTLLWSRRTTSESNVSRMTKDIADLGVHPTWKSVLLSPNRGCENTFCCLRLCTRSGLSGN